MKKMYLLFCMIPAIWPLGSVGARSQELPRRFRDDDTRLTTKVTISTRRILVGDLLDGLSKQTGIAIDFNGADIGPGMEVLISCRNRPVSDMLDAIGALMSSTDGRYIWNREKTGGEWRYSLYEMDAIKKRHLKLAQHATEAYLKYVDTLCDLSGLTPTQRDRRRSEFKRAYLDADPKRIDSLFNSESLWNRVSLFADLVPRDQRSGILLGLQPVSVPVSQLTEKTRSKYESMWAALKVSTTGGNGATVPVPMPTSIDIRASAPRGEGITPALEIAITSFSSFSLINSYGLGLGLMNAVKRSWLLPGDSMTSADETRAVNTLAGILNDESGEEPSGDRPPAGMDQHPVSRELQQRRPRSRGWTIAATLQQVSEGAEVPILAVLPQTNLLEKPDGKAKLKVSDLLNALELFDITLMHKWHSGVLLVSYAPWFFKNDLNVPYSIVNEFLGPKHDEDLTFTRLAKLMGRIDDRQMDILSKRYARVRNVGVFRPILRLTRVHPQMCTPEGMSIDPETLRYLQNECPYFWAKPEILNGSIQRLRFIAAPPDDATPGRTGFTIQARADANWIDYGRLYLLKKS